MLDLVKLSVRELSGRDEIFQSAVGKFRPSWTAGQTRDTSPDERNELSALGGFANAIGDFRNRQDDFAQCAAIPF